MTKIDNYEFGEITINGKCYNKDLKIFPSPIGIKENWWRDEGHYLKPEDLEDVFSFARNDGLQELIIGTGAYGTMEVDDKVFDYAEKVGVNVLVQNTEEACKTYSQLSEEGKKKAVLAVHLTC